MRRRSRLSGRLLFEAAVATMIIGVMLAGINDTYREGQRVRRRVEVDELVRREVANTLATARAAVRNGKAAPAATMELAAVDASVSGQVAVETKPAGQGLVKIVVMATWTSGEHNGERRREVLVRTVE